MATRTNYFIQALLDHVYLNAAITQYQELPGVLQYMKKENHTVHR